MSLPIEQKLLLANKEIKRLERALLIASGQIKLLEQKLKDEKKPLAKPTAKRRRRRVQEKALVSPVPDPIGEEPNGGS